MVIGHAFVLSAWMVEKCVTTLVVLPVGAFRRFFGATWIYKSFGKLQGTTPSKSVFVRMFGRLIFIARNMEADPADALAVRGCLGAASETLLERRYGISRDRAHGPNGEWGVWYSVLGKPVKEYIEARSAGRVTLASGLAGFGALSLAPSLMQRHFVAMCSVFVFCGLWTSIRNFLQFRKRVNFETLRLMSVMLELQELSSEPKPREKGQAIRGGENAAD
jgi:hypothetical protein